MKTSLEEVTVSKVITKVIDGVKYTESAVEELTGYKTCTYCNQTKDLNLFTIKKKEKRFVGRSHYSSVCKACNSYSMKERYKLKREELLEYQKSLNKRQLDTYRARKNSNSASYRAKQRKATPPWITKEHTKQMTELFKERERQSVLLGVGHHVDHIIPINSPYVCGLHVPWNLEVITEELNLLKNNKIDNGRLSELYQNYYPFEEDPALLLMIAQFKYER